MQWYDLILISIHPFKAFKFINLNIVDNHVKLVEPGYNEVLHRQIFIFIHHFSKGLYSNITNHVLWSIVYCPFNKFMCFRHTWNVYQFAMSCCIIFRNQLHKKMFINFNNIQSSSGITLFSTLPTISTILYVHTRTLILCFLH